MTVFFTFIARNRDTKSIRLFSHLALLAVFLIVTYDALLSGRYTTSGAVWFLVLPIGASYLLGHLWGIVWSLPVFLVIGLCAVLDANGMLSPREMDSTMRITFWLMDLFGGMFLVLFFLSMSESIRKRSLMTLREANQLLDEREGRLKSLVRHLPLAVWMVEKDGHVELAGGEWAQFFDVTEGQPSEADFHDIFSFNQDISRGIEAAFEGEEGYLELAVKEEVFDFHFIPASLKDGRAERCMVLASEISASKRIKIVENVNKELRKTRDQALQASRAKSEFLASMSHELRTPLNAIIGYAELIDEELSDDGHDEYSPDLLKIRASGQHLLGLINSVLDLSKIEAGRMEVHAESFLIRDFVEEVAATTKPLASKNGNTLSVSALDGEESITTDPTKLRQIMFNLLSNACKFTTNGDIAFRVEVQSREGKEGYSFSVEDTGIGIEQDKLEEIFQPFSQADETISMRYGGTGLGLSICRQFAELMGGVIEVESVRGEGTQFRVWIPKEHNAKVEKKPRRKRDSLGVNTTQTFDLPKFNELEGRTILLIEQDEDVRDVAVRILSRTGYKVITTSGWEEGLRLMKEFSPSAVLIATQLSGFNGWEFLAMCRGDEDLRSTPTIMMLGRGETPPVVHQADGWVMKPLSRGPLIMALESSVHR